MGLRDNDFRVAVMMMMMRNFINARLMSFANSVGLELQ
jgi:hypothetical protein